MTHPAVIKTSQLILAGDLLGAEKALAEIADTEGDKALVALLDEVAPKDLLAIMREFDGSRESIINMVVTPEQFADAVVLESRYGEEGNDRLTGMINAIFYRDESMAIEYLEAIGEKEEGLNVLADYFAHRIDEILSFATTGQLETDFTIPETMAVKSITWLNEKIDEIDEALHDGDAIQSARPKQSRAEISDHDWMETAWILRYELTDTFEQLVVTIRDRMIRHMIALNEPIPEQGSAEHAADDEESAL
ncbi:MAG: hypothetical protein RIR18_1052 [Pseudomonadota bacterium]|jgi:hypothetical protein